MPFWKEHSKVLILFLVLCSGILITSPFANFQGYLSQGDHGRDLYAAQAVYRGELPYKDFWWNYGPLMPYYYGLFFKVLGVQIGSILLGQSFLRILAGILMCLGMMEVASPLAAFLCACWFMLFQQNFFFTYNHIGGLCMGIGTVFCLLAYIQRRSLKAAWGALGFIFILCLIKINFGIADLAVCVITIGVCDLVSREQPKPGKISFYAAALGGLPLLLLAIYYSLLRGLSLTEMRQCLPYFDPLMESGRASAPTPLMAIGIFLQMTWHTLSLNWTNITVALIINASALRCLYLLAKNKLPAARKTVLILSLGMLGLFYVANFHEYLKSGLWYRAFWAQPYSIMIAFLLIDTATKTIPKLIRAIIFLFLAVMIIICCLFILRQVDSLKTRSQYLPLPRAYIYMSNSPSWISTVEQTTEYLKATLKDNELFFALPYDCLYYYLTDRKAPTRQLIFFENIKISPQQERSVIAELEKKHVNYILLSNRAFAHIEPGLGVLGTDYCPLIEKYIEKNFMPVTRFGDWIDEPGWAWNHGTFILKRKTPLAAGR